MTAKESWKSLRDGCRITLLLLMCGGCTAPPPPPAAPGHVRHLVLITIDTLRADRVGAYGYARARTPHIDGLAARGVLFEHAYATAPITLPSHGSLMTGRYPPGHWARHNGIRIDSGVPTLAKALSAAGFATGAFVSAFPLDRRFGLDAGFAAYSDRMPRGARGRLENERPGRDAVNDALAWLTATRAGAGRLFLWVHLFEPHAPYGQPGSGRPVAERYDDEIAESDAQVGRVLDALGPDASSTLIVVASDHGEAFGEHGEVSHSLFVYDTTLRVPLVIAGPGVPARTVGSPVSLVDVAPTVLLLLGLAPFDSDGVDLSRTFSGADLPARDLYAESFAPLLDFGWSPLRALRAQGFKYIDAPRAELYDTTRDTSEARDLSTSDGRRAAELRDRLSRYSTPTLEPDRLATLDREALGRLQALGYASGSGRGSASARPDPKDRRAIAARLAEVISGELEGEALERALRKILDDDPKNPQANLRLGYVLLESNRCVAAVPFLKAAIAARMPTADAHLGLAQCQSAARRPGEVYVTLLEAERVEPDNPVVFANMGIVLSDMERHADAITALQRALSLDPDFHEARFNLARVYARAGQRSDAAREARDLLTRLPANARQRSEVQRLLDALR
jgi:arylsulfatase A-like enzyme/cytochrome c-type biogenesis protein CcmH/NrfG